MPPAARLTDMHACPMVSPGGVPHVGGPILPVCSANVLINFLPAARISDKCTCVGPPDVIVMGSPTVLINNLPAARIGDSTAHGGVIVMGSPNVMIGNSGSGAGAAPGGGGGAGAGEDVTVPLSPVASGGAMSAPARQAQALRKAAQKAAPFVEPCDGPDPAPPPPEPVPVPPPPAPPPPAGCCPDCATFTRHDPRPTYFGFDDKTNLTAPGTDPYQVTKPGAAPGDRMTRDGSNWLSVATGETTACIIGFEGSAPCIPNCTVAVEPAHVARVTSGALTAGGIAFTLRGEQPGDATVKVRCGGKDLGWVHVACRDLLTFRVGLCTVNQQVTGPGGAASLALPEPVMDVAAYQEFFDDAWRDAAVRVELVALPTHMIPPETSLMNGDFFSPDNSMELQHSRDHRSTRIHPVTDAIHAAVSAANPALSQFLYLMPKPQPGTGAQLNGFARGIGGQYAIFFNVNAGTFSTAAHEFGHLVGLRHPNDPNGAGQYPQHMRDVTNAGNVIATDQLNLMGYGGPRPERKRLRYLQWKAVAGRGG